MKNNKNKPEQMKLVDQQYEEEESDDEMPEAVSNAVMKTNYESVNKELLNLKQKLRQTEKAKRREIQERNIAQKKAKIPSDVLELEESDHDQPAAATVVNNSVNDRNREKDTKPSKKVYPSLNITVEPLTRIHDSRASLAVDFKTRRLGKVHRESVKSAVISYQKKLQVRK